MSDKRLYGLPGAEEMYFDPVEVYESEIDGQYPDQPEKVEIEEWSVHPPSHHLPSVAYLVELLEEWCYESGELTDTIDVSFTSPSVKEAAQKLLDTVAGEITWRMADKKLALHWVTWAENGEPLLDGEPMYHKAPA